MNIAANLMSQAGNIFYFLLIIGVGVFFIFSTMKQQKAHQQLINGVQEGDSVSTVSGFYGVVIEVMDDIVIVEFGSNENCRIPMKKTAIDGVEKPKQGNEEIVED